MVCDLLRRHSLALLTWTRHGRCVDKQLHHIHAARAPIAMPDRTPRQRRPPGEPQAAALQYAPALPGAGLDRR